MSKIPKIIHYCWFGNNEKPELVKKCIESWKKFLPTKIIEEFLFSFSTFSAKYFEPE